MTETRVLSLTPEQIQSLLIEGVRKELDSLKEHFQPKEPTVYLTRNEVAEMLKIDLSSVHNWTKKGKLISYGIGSRVYYRKDEIEQSIIKL